MSVIQVQLSDDDINKIVKMVVEAVKGDEVLNQYTLNGLMTRDVYLRAARRNRFPSSKQGQLVCAKRSDVERYLLENPRVKTEEKPAKDPNEKVKKKGFKVI